MRLIRRWPKLRRRVVVARRYYSKVYWYCWVFKEEFVNEIFRHKVDKDDLQAHLPLYYITYLWVRVSEMLVTWGSKCKYTFSRQSLEG